LAAVPLVLVGLLLGPTGTAHAASTCTASATITQGKYYVNNNLWGRDAGNGWQCSWDSYQSGNTIGWGTNWDWTSKSPAQDNSVKSYASSVLGWHWGWKTTGTQLPTQLSARKAVRTDWSFNVRHNRPGTMNVAYDLWLHDKANPDWPDNPTDEVMIWLYRTGGAGPVGSKVATLNIGGATWDLYQGDIGWKVHSFIRTSNTTSASLDLSQFTRALENRGSLSSNKYLSSVQAGTEVFHGAGQLDTTAYSVTVG
jgi:hypothetical protein